MKSKLLFFSLGFFIFLSSCNSDFGRMQKKWIGETIIPPGTLTRIVNDSISLDKPLKILFYVDSVSCAPCQLRLAAWWDYINRYKDVISFFFISHPSNKLDILAFCKQSGFDYPIFLDMNNIMQRAYHFPESTEYCCFLLDRDNHVIAVGHPLQNAKAFINYQKQITTLFPKESLQE